ncbi:MAG: nucleotidyltransferase family protein [Acidobacteria bacterium]|nr:nucleotidyltransferase family protein [Acidobacteriota bacterium]
MNREEVLRILREHEPQLKAAGIVHLRLFGSVARGEQRPDSDVDLMAEFDDERVLSLLDLAKMKIAMEDLLGRDVDFIEQYALKPRIRQRAEAEAVSAF